jgi:hypothetical protein
MRPTKRTLVGVDPGETQCGVAIITENGIQKGMHISNTLLIDFIYECKKNSEGDFLVVMEDMRPYNMRITDNIINTIKFIGEIQWRLQSLGIEYLLYPRWQIKSWAFSTYPDMCSIEIQKKIDYAIARERLKKGEDAALRKRTASFVYVDDRIVEKAMKLWWNIKKPKVGEKTAFGLKTHSWLWLHFILSQKILPSFGLQIALEVQHSLLR